MRRTLILITGVAMLAMPAPATADTVTAPVTVASWSQALQVFEGLEQAVGPPEAARTSGMVTDAIGWTLASIGLAVDADSAEQVSENLEDISDSLQQVQQSLTAVDQQIAQMQVELAAVSVQQAWADCAEQTQGTSQPVAVIQSASDEYNQFITQATSANGSEPAPTVEALVDWAQDYTSGAKNLLTALNDIADVLSGTQQTGSLQACGQALYSMYSTSALNFEENYYGPLYQYLSYWYQTQVQGLNLYVEAQHVLALDAAGDLTGFQPTDPAVICTQDISGAVTTACDNAQASVNTVYDAIRGQIFIAGAPYLWGSGDMVTAAAPAQNNKAWLVDINDYNSTGCVLPLTSNTSACGGTVGSTWPLSPTTWGPFSWGSYSNWQPAVTADWLALMPASQQKLSMSGTYASWMAQLGFGDSTWGPGAGLENLLIYTSEITESSNPDLNAKTWMNNAVSDYQNAVDGMCLLDTAAYVGSGGSAWVRPLCDDEGGGILSVLLASFDGQTSEWSGVAPGGAEGNYPGGGPFTNTAFYTANFSQGPKNSPWWINQVPGWMTGTYGLSGNTTPQGYLFTPSPQYRWPVFVLSNSLCSVTTPAGSAMTVTTSVGAYTMCGADFAAWLAVQLPPAPSPVVASGIRAKARPGGARISWKVPRAQRYAVGYRIRGKRGDGVWRTLATVNPSARQQRFGVRLHVRHPGVWRFRVVTLLPDRRSHPSAASRAVRIVGGS